MNSKIIVNPEYPVNAYIDIFGKEIVPYIPEDAAETLEYAMGFLSTREGEMFLLKYRDAVSYEDIGEKYGLTGSWINQIIKKAQRKLRHPSRKSILKAGRVEYLKTIVVANEEKKKQCLERISELEGKINNQDQEIAMYQDKLICLNSQFNPIIEILDLSIEELDLSVRSWNCLNRAGIKTIREILDYDDICNIPNLGQISVQELRTKIMGIIKRYKLENHKIRDLISHDRQ